MFYLLTAAGTSETTKTGYQKTVHTDRFLVSGTSYWYLKLVSLSSP